MFFINIMNDCFMWNLSTKMIANRDVGIDYQKDLVVCKPHRHTFIEIAYTVSGSAIHTLNGKKCTVSGGNYFIIKPGDWHRYEKIGDKPLKIINCIFTPRLFGLSPDKNSFLSLIGAPPFNIDKRSLSKNPDPHMFEDSDGKVLDLLYIMQYEYSNKSFAYESIMKNILTSIILYSVRSIGIPSLQTFNITGYIKDYVSMHCSDENILRTISEKINYSVPYLSRKFKKDTGMTFKSFLQETRINMAANILNETNLTIAETAKAVGYSQMNFFIEIFKKYKNVTPSKYRIASGDNFKDL